MIKSSLIKKIEGEFKQFTNSMTIQSILEVISLGYSYSWFNTMLIYMQANARKTVESIRGTFNGKVNWQKKFNAIVNVGWNEGYDIFVPLFKYYKGKEKDNNTGEEKEVSKKYLLGFKVVKVYDVSQTDKVNEYDKKQKEIDNKVYDKDFDYNEAKRILDLHSDKVKVYYNSKEAKRGCYIPTKNEIHIAEEVGDTIIHELGHYYTYDKEKSYAYNELTAEIFRCQICKLYDVKFNYTYSQIWNSRLSDVLTFEEFDKAWKSVKKIVDDIDLNSKAVKKVA